MVLAADDRGVVGTLESDLAQAVAALKLRVAAGLPRCLFAGAGPYRGDIPASLVGEELPQALYRSLNGTYSDGAVVDRSVRIAEPGRVIGLGGE